MDGAEPDLLRTPRILAAVAAEVTAADGSDPVARSTALRRAGFSPAESSAVLLQADLRRRARAKFGEFADRMLFTRAGLEQATRLPVAAQHAGRLRAAGATTVADLGCGIGGDAMAFAAIGLRVLAVERDPVTAAIARHNLEPFPEAVVVQADAEAADLAGCDAAWLDPARRTAGHSGTRRVGPADYSPGLDFALDVARSRPTGVKLSPAHDRSTLPEGAEAQWVSASGDVVELVLWAGGAERPGIERAALVLSVSGTAEMTGPADAPDEPPGALGAFVHEPDGAVIRARLLGDLARATSTRPVGPGIAYLTGEAPVDSPFLTSFAVEEVLPFDRRRIAAALRVRGVGRLEVKKRGVDLDPPAFRRSIALRGDSAAVLIVTRTTERRVALICRRSA